MDGVLTDWVGTAAKLMGVDYPTKFEGDYPVWEFTKAELWQRIDREGIDYWANMPKTLYCDEILEMANQLGDVYILTSPSQHSSSAAGKMIWMKKHLGKGFRNFLIGPKKYLCSRPGSVLIDDRDTNVNAFNAEGGGLGILCPQPWNAARDRTGDRLGYIRERLK